MAAEQFGELPPVLNRERLRQLEREFSDRELIRQTAQIFIAELPERIAGIEQVTVDPIRPADYARAVHALVSPSAMLGVERLAATCREVEQSASTITPADALAALQRIRSVARESAGELAGYVARIGEPPP